MATLATVGINPDTKWLILNVSGPASYVNGTGFDPGFPSVGSPILIVSDNQSGYLPVGDYANKKVKVFWCAGSGAPATEITNGTNLSAVSFRILVAWRE
jgi:hypothetical protein